MGNSLCLSFQATAGTRAVNTTFYTPIGGTPASHTTESFAQINSRGSGVYSKLTVKVSANSLSTASTTIQFRKNAGNGNQTFAISAGATGYFDDPSNTDTTADGDDVCFQTVVANSGTGTITIVGLSVVFAADSNTMSVLIVGGLSYSTASQTVYPHFTANFATNVVAETNAQHEVRIAGTLKNFQVNINTNARTTNTTFRTRKNTANGNCLVTIGSTATGQFEDTANSDSLAVNDKANFSVTTLTGAQAIAIGLIKIGYEITASADSLYITASNSGAVTNAVNTTKYLPFSGQITSSATDTVENKISYNSTASNMGIIVTTNSITAASTLTFRQNGTDTALTISVASSTTGVFKDTSNTVSLSSSDTVGYEIVTGATGTTFNCPQISIYCLAAAAVLVTRSISESSISVSETVVDILIGVRSQSETAISVSESLARLLTAKRTLAEASITVSDANSANKTNPRTISESSIAVSETLSRKLTALRTLTESSISVSESVARVLLASRVLTESTISVSETLARKLSAFRTISESAISVSESLARLLTAIRSLTESSIPVSDTLARILTALRTLTESTIAVSESVASLKIGGLVTRTITESSIPVSETVTRILTTLRSLSEPSISVSESLARQQTSIRILTDTVAVSEALARVKTMSRTIAEAAISVSESLARLAILSRTLTESTINVSESVARVKTLIRTITETAISVSEALARQLNAFRTISESAISVSESLARLLTAIRTQTESTIAVSDAVSRATPFVRTISEAAISVNESLAKVAIKIRTISEAAISVSETLARMTSLFRTISEPTINVSESLARAKVALRTIAEAAISVSETLTKLVPFARAVSDTVTVSESLARLSINIRLLTDTIIVGGGTAAGINLPLKSRFITETVAVTEQLNRILKAFRILPTDIISVLPGTVVAGIVPPEMATVITDTGYKNELRLLVKFIDRKISSKVHYEYNSYFPSERPFNLLSCSVRLAQGEVGAFSMEIEDHLKEVDADNIGFNSKIQIFVRKELGGQWVQLMTGYVRRVQKVRSMTDTLIYRVNGYGTQIVFNERITDFKRAAKKSAVDSIDPLPTDSKMFANNLFGELITATDILPLRGPSLAAQAGFTLDAISPEVSDFIAAVAPGLTDAAQVANAFAELTGAIWGVNSEGNPYFRYPTQKHSGIIIKDNPQDTDSAFNTSINMGSFDYEDTIDLAEGFANRLYVLNAVDTKSTASSSKGLGSTTLTTRGIAQQFTATDNNITGAAFILSRVGNPTTTTNSISVKLRTDNNGYPNGSTLATAEIAFSSIDTSKSTIFINDIKPLDGTIIPGNKYWWYLLPTGGILADDTNTIRWHHDNDQVTTGRFSATLPLFDLDPTKPGTQANWIRSDHGPVYSFSTFSSIRHILEHSDPESIANYGLIEGIVDLPAFEDDATFQKALVQILRSSSKPKRIYEHNQVTIPTQKLFFPGELVTLIDSKANLTAQKNVTAEIAEVLYNFNSNDNAMGCKYVDLRAISFVDKVLDDYLNTSVCTED